MKKHIFSMEYGKSFASAFDVSCSIKKALPSQSNEKNERRYDFELFGRVQLPVVGACCMYLHQVP